VVVHDVLLPFACLQGQRADIADAMAAWVRAEAFDKQRQWWDTNSWPRVYL
jgi:hypothetical protein